MKEDNTKRTEEAFEMRAEYDFAQGVRGRFHEPQKVSTSIRLDDDIILFFKKKAKEEKVGYQTLMNLALRQFINQRVK